MRAPPSSALPLVASIVVPMKNEAENVELLVNEIEQACRDVCIEAIFVDDGSTDATRARILAAMASRPWLRLVVHGRSGGQSAAVHSGVLAARAALVCTLDGDGQNPPSEIPHLLAPFLVPGRPEMLGLVAGQRVNRADTLSKRIASRIANAIRARVLSDATRDTGCGLKAFRRDVFLELPYFNHMHRYLPALVAAQGFTLAHVDVAHRSRHAGVSNYTNLQRALVGLHDLVGVAWLIRRRKIVRPEEQGVRSCMTFSSSSESSPRRISLG
ncbi:glycosyltransferase family 2 protein [Rhizobium sp. Leaf341]|uniref:glycosyltransferase family 2 protein n=1 Tax=Rhizobium sp. Leaf341 TaxID=1736344 RepID=UPI000A3FBE37|nr:glycosyltransferase family 2 protein [Rhizobium sp. Leaf341]